MVVLAGDMNGKYFIHKQKNNRLMAPKTEPYAV